MKVAELKRLLEGVPDDAEVLAETADYGEPYIRNGIANRAALEDCLGVAYFVIGADIDKPHTN